MEQTAAGQDLRWRQQHNEEEVREEVGALGSATAVCAAVAAASDQARLLRLSESLDDTVDAAIEEGLADAVEDLRRRSALVEDVEEGSHERGLLAARDHSHRSATRHDQGVQVGDSPVRGTALSMSPSGTGDSASNIVTRALCSGLLYLQVSVELRRSFARAAAVEEEERRAARRSSHNPQEPLEASPIEGSGLQDSGNICSAARHVSAMVRSGRGGGASISSLHMRSRTTLPLTSPFSPCMHLPRSLTLP